MPRHKGPYTCPRCGASYSHDQANPHAVYFCPYRGHGEEEPRGSRTTTPSIRPYGAGQEILHV